jgi:hypothetical protein
VNFAGLRRKVNLIARTQHHLAACADVYGADRVGGNLEVGIRTQML